jgi:hypothetical protein
MSRRGFAICKAALTLSLGSALARRIEKRARHPDDSSRLQQLSAMPVVDISVERSWSRTNDSRFTESVLYPSELFAVLN